MKSNLWIFGDSFSNGDGCNLRDEYYNKFPKQNGKFSDILSDKLNLNLINLSKNGVSNSWILRQLILNIHKIKSGDVVIVNYTDPYRFECPSPSNQLIQLIHTSAYKHHPVFDEFGTDSDENNAIYYYSRYIHLMDIPDTKLKGYDILQREINYQFDSIFEHFKNIGVRFTTYDWCLEGFKDEYTTIVKETNGEIDDFHLSWLGHQEISVDLLYCIENNIKVLYYPVKDSDGFFIKGGKFKNE